MASQEVVAHVGITWQIDRFNTEPDNAEYDRLQFATPNSIWSTARGRDKVFHEVEQGLVCVDQDYRGLLDKLYNQSPCWSTNIE